MIYNLTLIHNLCVVIRNNTRDFTLDQFTQWYLEKIVLGTGGWDIHKEIIFHLDLKITDSVVKLHKEISSYE